MAEQVVPSQGEASSHLTSGVIKNAAQVDWIVPSGTDYLAAFAGLSGTPLNGYEETHAGNSLDLDIDTGESFVGGRWAAKDTTETVTLTANQDNQTVYLGWSATTADEVIIGLDSAFTSSDPGTDRRLAIYECDTDGDGITNVDTLYNNAPIIPQAADAQTLDGVSSEAFGQLSQNETVDGLWTFNNTVTLDDPNPGLALDITGSNEVDSNVVQIVGDADDGQDDDLLHILGVGDPSTDTPTNSDSVFNVKGDGRVGINNYNATAALDVIGDTNLRGNLDMNQNQISNTQRVEIDEFGDGAIHAVSGDRYYIAPLQEDNAIFSSEITYIANNDEWKVESERFTAPNASVAINNNDVVTGDDFRRRADVSMEIDSMGANSSRDTHVSLDSEDAAKVLRVSMTDEQGNEPPAGARVTISGEGGGQSVDFATRLAVGTLDNPLADVSGTGSVRVRLFNGEETSEELGCHVTMHVL